MLNRHVRRHPLRHATRIVTLVSFIAVTVPVAIAQNRFWTFSGSVVDQMNRAVPDTTLVLANDSTGAKDQVRTDRAGHFEFIGLPSADYQLAVQKPGFKTVKETVAVAGKDLTRAIHLQIEASGRRSRCPPAGRPRRVGRSSRRGSTHSRQRAQEIRRRASEKCGGGATGGDVGGRTAPPLKVIDVRPEYSEALKAAGIAGVVTLDALIGTDGTVREVTVLSSPHPDLEKAAADAVRKWEFTPTYLNRTPVEVAMRVTVNFVTP